MGWIITLTIVAALAIAFKILASKHRAWMEDQSPVGLWKSEHDNRAITLRFSENTGDVLPYELTSSSENDVVKEAGSWVAHLSELRLLPMAYDGPDEKELGAEEIFRIRYTAPNEISIDSGQETIVYQRVQEDAS